MDRLALTQEGHARLIDHLRGWIERYPKNSLVWFALIVATLDQEGHREAAHLVRRWDRERDAALNSEWYWRAESLTDLSLLGVPTTMPAPIFDTDIPGEDTIPFIDREQERAQLSRLVRLLASGQGGIQVVTGEPGVGKTRMLSVLSQFAVRQGIRPVKIDCCEYALPLQPWRDLLPPLWSESLRDPRTPLRALTRHRVLLLRLLGPNGLDPALPGPAQGVERLTDLAVQLVRHATARQPLLLFLENAHHLDPDSLLVLERLVPRLASQPIMILITLRHAEVPPDSHLAKWLDGRDSLEILPLDRDYTERLMECILGERPTREMVAIALRHTGGNPLLLLQGLAMNALDKPLELGNMAKSMLLPTVRSLTKPCQEWLKAAAVLAVGQGFSPRLVNGMLRYSATIGDACVGEARRARVVAPSNDRFCHDLWRDVILSETNGDAGRA